VQLVSAQAGQVFRNDDPDLSAFHIGHHLLKAGTLEIRARISVIHIKTGVRKIVIICVPLKNHFLILNGIRLVFRIIILAETTIQSGLFLV
jgi:hypothetical protein